MQKCKGCGADVKPNEACAYCGTVSTQASSNQTIQPTSIFPSSGSTNSVTPSVTPNEQLDPKFTEIFAQFDNIGGKFKATFSLPGFFFGCLYYLYKGMWQKAIVIFLATLVSTKIAGFAPLLVWIYTSVAANYDYYLFVKSGKKQLLDNGFKWW